MRQNTDAIQASTLHGMMGLTTEYLLNTSLDPEFARLARNAVEDPENLDEYELRLMRRIQRSQWFRYQAAFQHWRRGSLGDEDWESYENFICLGTGVFGVPLMARFWLEDRHYVSEEFAAYIEECNPHIRSAGGN